ncbi:MAG: hypothetical protein DMG35_04165 [Acidobacteria bacterium]|nr:MAG: hypothetical protein DMG35_04165 [Acidobacteriota bacterium]
MMRLPAPLIAKLLQSRIARFFRSAPARSLIQCVEPAEILHPGSAAPVSHDKMQSITESTAPVIWIGGSEPLDHPGIAHFVRAIAQGGHYVFLETGGTPLRRRIHEFEPLPRLFLTVWLDAPQARESALAVEGLRAARLSGFFTVVHSKVRSVSDIAELKNLRVFLGEKDVDGWLITTASEDHVVAGIAAEARSLIPTASWRRFSELVEQELLLQAKGRESYGTSLANKPPAESCEESIRVA